MSESWSLRVRPISMSAANAYVEQYHRHHGNELLEKGLLPEVKNFWYGGTRTGLDSDREHEAAMTGNTFLSIEPLLAPAENKMLAAIDFWGWVIIGAETGNRKNKILPEREWVEEIVEACDFADVPVFMKDSLIPVVGEEYMRRGFPWEAAK